jgi:hypothetical protein
MKKKKWAGWKRHWKDNPYMVFYGLKGSKNISDDYVELAPTMAKAREYASRRLYPKYTVKKLKKVVK